MKASIVSVMKVEGVLLVSVPANPDDEMVLDLQEQVLHAMEGTSAKGLVLDISTVETVDSFFARTISETVKMVGLMGGITVLSGMRSAVAVTTTQLGLSLGVTLTALDVDRALEKLREALAESHMT